MRIEMSELAGAKVLAGTQLGRRIFGALLMSFALEPSSPEPLFLDFAGVEIATASFLREAVLAFRDAIRSRSSRLYPVIANPGESVVDELALLVEHTGDVLIVCSLTKHGKVSDSRLLGNLDPKQQLTYELVRAKGETDAGELMRTQPEQVKQTAWNNRLSGLAQMGLLFELTQGRSKRYRAIFEG